MVCPECNRVGRSDDSYAGRLCPDCQDAYDTEQQDQFSITDHIIAYEAGELSDEETIELFQRLVDSGLVWSLQGSYGRTAWDLIKSGDIHLPRIPERTPNHERLLCAFKGDCHQFRR